MTEAVPDLETLYRRYAPMVLRRVRCFYATGHEAEEILQEVFLKVAEKRDSFRHESCPVTWLYRVTTNHCISRLRKRQRRSELLREHAGQFATGAGAPRQEQRAFLRQMIDDLDEELVQIGLHYHVEGMTHREIARVVGCSPRTVGYRLEELRVRLVARAGEGGG